MVFDDVFEPVIGEMKPRLKNIRAFYSAGGGRFEGFDPLEDVLASGDTGEPDVTVDEFDESEILYTSGNHGKTEGCALCPSQSYNPGDLYGSPHWDPSERPDPPCRTALSLGGA